MDNLRWWQKGIVYEAYPCSFMDSNGDGIGDLQGIIDKLDYLVWLGVDILWVPPIFPSPMVDAGYDVTDYTDIDPVFGSLEAFDRLTREAHARGLRIVLDFVANHTSDQHPWFRESVPRATTRSATGIFNTIPPQAEGRPTTGSPASAAAPGHGTKRPASTTITPSPGNSRTSTGAIRRWSGRSIRYFASGSSAASTAYGSMPSHG